MKLLNQTKISIFGKHWETLGSVSIEIRYERIFSNSTLKPRINWIWRIVHHINSVFIAYTTTDLVLIQVTRPNQPTPTPMNESQAADDYVYNSTY